eukprot:XP_001698428.1 predicted protein [Chlamydomonas reinhardtii]
MALPPLQKSHSISREALAAAAELDVVLEENPGLLAVVSDMLRPESLPAGWEARFDAEKGRREYVHAGRGERLLYHNSETGEALPSHPLDPYFLELIARRRKELLIRTDGVGIRSAIAAKRLAAMGMPGVSVPPELQGFGALVTINEDEDEGKDDEDGPLRQHSPAMPEAGVTFEEEAVEGLYESEEEEAAAVPEPRSRQPSRKNRMLDLDRLPSTFSLTPQYGKTGGGKSKSGKGGPWGRDLRRWAAREAEAAQGEEEGEGGADSEARKAAAELKVLTEQLNHQLGALREELEVTKDELAQWRGLAGLPPERAREALAKVASLEARALAAEGEREELRERLQGLEEAVAAVPGGRAMLPPVRAAAGVGGASASGEGKLRPRGSSDSGLPLPRPDFNSRDVPLEAKHRVARIRDRATKLDSAERLPGMPPVPEPVLAGARDAELFALKRKLMALAAANKEVKDFSRAQAAQMRQVEVAHDEELAAARGEAAGLAALQSQPHCRSAAMRKQCWGGGGGMALGLRLLPGAQARSLGIMTPSLRRLPSLAIEVPDCLKDESIVDFPTPPSLPPSASDSTGAVTNVTPGSWCEPLSPSAVSAISPRAWGLEGASAPASASLLPAPFAFVRCSALAADCCGRPSASASGFADTRYECLAYSPRQPLCPATLPSIATDGDLSSCCDSCCCMSPRTEARRVAAAFGRFDWSCWASEAEWAALRDADMATLERFGLLHWTLDDLHDAQLAEAGYGLCAEDVLLMCADMEDLEACGLVGWTPQRLARDTAYRRLVLEAEEDTALCGGGEGEGVDSVRRA